jgi:hypothetical protein
MWKTWGEKNHIKSFVWKTERSMRVIGIKRRCYDNIKINFKTTGWEDVESILLA